MGELVMSEPPSHNSLPSSLPDALLQVQVTARPGEGAMALMRALHAEIDLHDRASSGSFAIASQRIAIGSGRFFAYTLGIPFGILYKLGYLLVVLVGLALLTAVVSGNQEWSKYAALLFWLAVFLYVLVRYAVQPVYRFAVSCAKSALARRAALVGFSLGGAVSRNIKSAKNERDLFHGYLGIADAALDVMEPGEKNSRFRDDLRALMGALAESRVFDAAGHKNLPAKLKPSFRPLVTLSRWMCLGCGQVTEKDRGEAVQYAQTSPVQLSSHGPGQSLWEVFSSRYGMPGTPEEVRVRVPSKTALNEVTSLLYGSESPAQAIQSDYSTLESRLFATGYSSAINLLIEHRVRRREDPSGTQLDEIRQHILETTSLALGLPVERDKPNVRILSYAGIQDPLLAKMSLAFSDDDKRPAQTEPQ
jgi:hypothetical protein